MVQQLVREQDQDLWLFVNQFKRSFKQMTVVDLLEENCYELTDKVAPIDYRSYPDWLQLFIETEVENDQQTQLYNLLKPDNIVKTINSSNFLSCFSNNSFSTLRMRNQTLIDIMIDICAVFNFFYIIVIDYADFCSNAYIFTFWFRIFIADAWAFAAFWTFVITIFA